MGNIRLLCVLGVLLATLFHTTWQMADESRLSLEDIDSVKSFVSKRKRQNDGKTLTKEDVKALADAVTVDAIKKALAEM
ncbi:exendin-3-like [Sceloporus undulatus]|uniref:exendin-3-like n=1 Tax=Sceloporus undulatus TaxID=8520 RepID=UPI001C4C0499|nr:exendin-3-like [Sceloporus undulatus]